MGILSPVPLTSPDNALAAQREAFLRRMEETLDLAPNSLTGEEPLRAIQSWDSLAVLEYLALADQQFGVAIDHQQVIGCQTIGDLFDLAAS